MVFGNWAEILTSDVKVVESQDKAHKVYFDERNNFVEDSFSARPLLFAIIGIIGLIGY